MWNPFSRPKKPVALSTVPYSFPSSAGPIASDITTTGTSKSRLSHGRFQPLTYTYSDLFTAYCDIGLAQQIVDMPVMDALAIPPMYEGVLAEDEVGLNLLLEEACINARLYGVCFIVADPTGMYGDMPEIQRAQMIDIRSILKADTMGVDFKTYLFASLKVGQQPGMEEPMNMWEWWIEGRPVPLDRVCVVFGRKPPKLYNTNDSVFRNIIDFKGPPIPGTSVLRPLLPLIYQESELRQSMTESGVQNNLLHIAKEGFVEGLTPTTEDDFLIPHGKGTLITGARDKVTRVGTDMSGYPDALKAQLASIARDAGIPEGRLTSVTSPGWSSTGEADQDLESMEVASDIEQGMFRPVLRWVQEMMGAPMNRELFTFTNLVPRVDEAEGEGNDVPGE